MYIIRGIYILMRRSKLRGAALALPMAYAVISALPRGALSPAALVKAAILASLLAIAAFGAISIASCLAAYKREAKVLGN